jgi:FlaA1/EpsC-like NDP-sugar epimerase
MKKQIFCEKIYSRWLILLIDLFILSFSFSISYLAIHQFNFQLILEGKFVLSYLLYVLLSLVVFIAMQIHAGIIRYSNTEDIFRIIKALLINSLLFLAFYLVIIYPIIQQDIQSLGATILFNFFISATLLITLRIIVKNLFAYLIETEIGVKENILIYGSDASAILIKQAFEFSPEKKYHIIGFIDDDEDKINKHVEQKMVYPTSAIHLLRYKFGVDKMVITDNFLNEDHKKYALETCINLGIKVISVPNSSQWVNGRLSLNQIRNLKIEDLLQRDPIVLQNDNILRELSGKRVLITGAAGSIGAEIVRQLINYHPESIILCDQAETPLHEIQLEIEDQFKSAPIFIFMANIQNKKRLNALFANFKPQIVFHAAAYKHVPMMENNPSEAILTNVLGTKNLADMAIDYKVEKFIMISTDKAVNPTNVMGASKRLAEMYIQSLNFYQASHQFIDEILQIPKSSGKETKFITTRFGNVLGSNGSVVPRFQEQIKKGGPITITHPDITRYFMTIPESVQLVLEASAMGKGGEIFIFDMGSPIKIVDMAKNMIKLAGLIPNKDIKIVFTGLRPGEKLYEELLNKAESVRATHHAKIKISSVAPCHYLHVKKEIDELLRLNDLNDQMVMVRKMKEIVPEFISNNSKYDQLDLMVTL